MKRQKPKLLDFVNINPIPCITFILAKPFYPFFGITGYLVTEALGRLPDSSAFNLHRDVAASLPSTRRGLTDYSNKHRERERELSLICAAGQYASPQHVTELPEANNTISLVNVINRKP